MALSLDSSLIKADLELKGYNGRVVFLSKEQKKSQPLRAAVHSIRPFGLFTLEDAEVLYVDSLFLGHSLLDGRLLEVLACAKLADCTGLLEFTLEALQCAFNVVAVFDRYDNHAFKAPPFFFWDRKGMK